MARTADTVLAADARNLALQQRIQAAVRSRNISLSAAFYLCLWSISSPLRQQPSTLPKWAALPFSMSITTPTSVLLRVPSEVAYRDAPSHLSPLSNQRQVWPDHAHWCPCGPRTAFSSPLTMSSNTGCGRRHVLQVSGDWWGQLDKWSSTCGPETDSGKQRDWPTHLQPLLWQFHMDQTVLIHTTSLLPRGFNQADKRAQPQSIIIVVRWWRIFWTAVTGIKFTTSRLLHFFSFFLIAP